MSLTRRHLLLAGAAGTLSLGTAAPALADSPFSQSFLTRREDRAGWNPDAPTKTQLKNARLIIAVGKGYDIPAYGAMIALSAAIVESWLYNRDTITDGTSGGLFQQQTSQGWGSHARVRNKFSATKAFYGVAKHTPNPGLLDIRRWQSRAIGDAAQRVQRSAYPGRYEDHADEAIALYDALAGDVAPFRG